MKVLSRTKVKLSSKAAAIVQLPNKRSIEIKLVEKQADGRYRVQVSVKKPGGGKPTKMTVLAKPGEPFIVAGHGHKGGTLVIGITIR